MPLHLQDDYTSRYQLVVWDPHIVAEAKDALQTLKNLKKKGFTVINKSLGQVTLAPPEKPDDVGIMRVLTKNGDDRLTWDRRNPKEIADAVAHFNKLTGQGYQAFSVTSNGKRGHRIDSFDPAAEEIIMVPGTRPG